MIERHPELADPFLVLERRETLGDYARAYGDRLAEHYERLGAIVIPHLPIDFDLEFLQQLEFPREWKKVGTLNGIEQPVLVRTGGQIAPDATHPLVAILGEIPLAVYVQSQIARFNSQLRIALRVLFPRYYSLERNVNITWRLTETRDEGMHLDVFDSGRPMSAKLRAQHRVKIFVNIDTEPRRWRVSYDLPELLKRCRDQLPDALPDDVNVLNNVLDKIGVLDALPAHQVAYPTMSAVIVNAEAVAHEVVFGRRMVAGEFICDSADMLDPARHTHACLGRWLGEAGIRVADDAAKVARDYADLMGSYEYKQLSMVDKAAN
ncbi:MAG: hypothetical protein AMJ64_09675 [Betaproteobacteria bacterium SG8_39]|nr:MAG: hypothetical protein AMJ64_09675 [Betaproteobacteria bacterium SG8_39]